MNIKQTTFRNSFYNIGFHIPVFRMLLQHNDSLYLEVSRLGRCSLYNTEYKSCQESSIIQSRTSLMYNRMGPFIKQRNLKLNFSKQELNVTDKDTTNTLYARTM